MICYTLKYASNIKYAITQNMHQICYSLKYTSNMLYIKINIKYAIHKNKHQTSYTLKYTAVYTPTPLLGHHWQ